MSDEQYRYIDDNGSWQVCDKNYWNDDVVVDEDQLQNNDGGVRYVINEDFFVQ